MNINKILKLCGYADLFISSAQIMVAMVTTVWSTYNHVQREDFGKGWISNYVWPVVNVVVAGIFVLVSAAQIQRAWELTRAGNEEVGSAERQYKRDNWICRNKITSKIAVIWFSCFGFPTFWSNEWSVALIVTLFLGTVLSRGMVTWGVHGVTLVEEIEMEGQQAGQRRPQTPYREPRWIIRHTGYGGRGNI